MWARQCVLARSCSTLICILNHLCNSATTFSYMGVYTKSDKLHIRSNFEALIKYFLILSSKTRLDLSNVFDRNNTGTFVNPNPFQCAITVQNKPILNCHAFHFGVYNTSPLIQNGKYQGITRYHWNKGLKDRKFTSLCLFLAQPTPFQRVF